MGLISTVLFWPAIVGLSILIICCHRTNGEQNGTVAAWQLAKLVNSHYARLTQINDEYCHRYCQETFNTRLENKCAEAVCRAVARKHEHPFPRPTKLADYKFDQKMDSVLEMVLTDLLKVELTLSSVRQVNRENPSKRKTIKKNNNTELITMLDELLEKLNATIVMLKTKVCASNCNPIAVPIDLNKKKIKRWYTVAALGYAKQQLKTLEHVLRKLRCFETEGKCKKDHN